MLCKYDTRPPGCHTSIHSHTHKLLYIYTNFQPCISVKTYEQSNYSPRRPPKLIISQAFIEKNINIKYLNKKRQISQQQTVPTKSDKSLNNETDNSKSNRSHTIIIATANCASVLQTRAARIISEAELKCQKSC